MKTLADEIFDLLAPGERLTIAATADRLAASRANVSKAMGVLRDARRADIVRFEGAGRELFLVKRGTRAQGLLNVCANCGKSFARRHKGKTMNCSKSCAQQWIWRDATVHARRCEAISVQKKSPEAVAITRATNAARWARVGEREKLAELNKEHWADPAIKAKMSRGIRAIRQLPEKRAHSSEIRKAHWRDPEKRAKMVAGIKRSKSSPEARAEFSRLLRERWKDPVMREKYTKANHNRNNPEARVANSERMKAWWADPDNAALARNKSNDARRRQFEAKKTAERLALMIAMLANHKTIGDVAQAMGECYGFARKWASELGLKSSPRKSAEVRARISTSNIRTHALRRHAAEARI